MVVAAEDEVDAELAEQRLVRLPHALDLVRVQQARRVETRVHLDDEPRGARPVDRRELAAEPLEHRVRGGERVGERVGRQRDDGGDAGQDRGVVQPAALVGVGGRGGREVGDGRAVEGLLEFWVSLF